MKNALATQESQLTVQHPPAPDIGSMLQAVIDRGVTTENVAVMEQLVGLFERMEAKRAEKEFAAAMVALKEDLQKDPVRACKGVPDNQGTIKYKYAPLEEVDAKLCPLALRHGFTYAFAEAASDPGKVTKVCVITHISGHSRPHPVTVRVGQGPPKASDCQSDGAAGTYAKRQALLDAFGIVAEKDTDGASDDPKNEGRPITAEQAADIERRCLTTKTNRRNFLDFLGVDVEKGGSFKDIMSSRYADADAELKDRERKQQVPKEEPKKDADGNYIF